jgi:tetratricopeptide (TPR) repeat protein
LFIMMSMNWATWRSSFRQLLSRCFASLAIRVSVCLVVASALLTTQVRPAGCAKRILAENRATPLLSPKVASVTETISHPLNSADLLAFPTQSKQQGTTDFKTLAEQAGQASQQNRLDDAIALYQKALALKPSWADGWWSLGTIRYDRDEYQKAAIAFRRVIALQPDKGSPRVMLGLCEFELGEDDKALRDIEEGKERGLNPDEQFQQVTLFHEGVLLLRKGRFNRAGETFSDLSKSGVQNEDLTLDLGMAALRMLPKSLPAEGTPGRDVVHRVGTAEGLAALKKFDDAKAEYEKVVSEYPEYPNIHYAQGRFLLGLSDVDGAVAAFQQELKNSPRNVAAMLQIAAARYRLDSADGLKYAEQAVKLDPGEPFGHYLLGLLCLDTGDYTRAISELEFAKKYYAKIPDVYFALGNAYARSGQKEKAAQARAVFVKLNAESKKESMGTANEDRAPKVPSQGGDGPGTKDPGEH